MFRLYSRKWGGHMRAEESSKKAGAQCTVFFSWTQSKGKQSKQKAYFASFVFSAVTVYEEEEEKRRKAGK